MSLWKWSQTAATNTNADPTINWAEGMAPSAVNDSSRAMMAAIAKYRDDISGSLVTSGGPGGYNLTTNQGFDTLAHLDKAKLVFTPNVTNGVFAQITLNVDSLGTKPIRLAPSVEIPDAGVLLQGIPYSVTYNDADGAFYLNDQIHNVYQVPIGGMVLWSGSIAPNAEFISPLGQALSRTIFSTLFALYNAAGLPFGVGDGVTTFNVPNMQFSGINTTTPPAAVSLPWMLRII